MFSIQSEKMRKTVSNSSVLFFIVITTFFGYVSGRSGLHSEQSAPPARIQQCREGCLEKFATEDFACLQEQECSMCWDQCGVPPTKINTSILDAWPIRTISMIQEGSLVSSDVAWKPFNEPNQCLVTWEVSGGGLMGNLLTDTSSVQLSLWPDTKYRVQVTCKNKRTEAMTRSLPLTLDTSNAILMVHVPSSIDLSDELTTSKTYLDNLITEFNHHGDLKVSSTLNHNQLFSTSTKDKIISHFHVKQRSSSSLGVWEIYESWQEIILGVMVAVLVFFIILTVFIVIRRKSRINNLKENLIENEVVMDGHQHSQTMHV